MHDKFLHATAPNKYLPKNPKHENRPTLLRKLKQLNEVVIGEERLHRYACVSALPYANGPQSVVSYF